MTSHQQTLWSMLPFKDLACIDITQELFLILSHIASGYFRCPVGPEVRVESGADGTAARSFALSHESRYLFAKLIKI